MEDLIHHPLDFNKLQFDEIKKRFHEKDLKQNTDLYKRRTKHGTKFLKIQDMEKMLVDELCCDQYGIERILSKIDHKTHGRISWNEYLEFLGDECNKREIVNDAQLFGCGVKRFVEGERSKPRMCGGAEVDYYIDDLILVPLQKKVYLCGIFENYTVKLFNEKFTSVHNIQLPQSHFVQKKSNVKAKLSKVTRSKSELDSGSEFSQDDTSSVYTRKRAKSRQSRSISSALSRISRGSNKDMMNEDLNRRPHKFDAPVDYYTQMNIGIDPQSNAKTVTNRMHKTSVRSSMAGLHEPIHELSKHKSVRGSIDNVQVRGRKRKGKTRPKTSIMSMDSRKSSQHRASHIRATSKENHHTSATTTKPKSNAKSILSHKSSKPHNPYTTDTISVDTTQKKKIRFKEGLPECFNSSSSADLKPKSVVMTKNEFRKEIAKFKRQTMNNSFENNLRPTNPTGRGSLSYGFITSQTNYDSSKYHARGKGHKLYGILGIDQLETMNQKEKYPNVLQDNKEFEDNKHMFESFMVQVDRYIQPVSPKKSGASSPGHISGLDKANRVELKLNKLRGKLRSNHGNIQDIQTLDQDSVQQFHKENNKFIKGKKKGYRKDTSQVAYDQSLGSPTRRHAHHRSTQSNERNTTLRQDSLLQESLLGNIDSHTTSTRRSGSSDRKSTSSPHQDNTFLTSTNIHVPLNQPHETSRNQGMQGDQANQAATQPGDDAQPALVPSQRDGRNQIGASKSQMDFYPKGDLSSMGEGGVSGKGRQASEVYGQGKSGEKQGFSCISDGAKEELSIFKSHQQQQYNRMYSLCGTFHKETKTLALSLVSKEVKLYRIRDTGQRLFIDEKHSFMVPEVITSIDVSYNQPQNLQVLANANCRLFLIGGTDTGHIIVYNIEDSNFNFKKRKQIIKKDGHNIQITQSSNDHNLLPEAIFKIDSINVQITQVKYVPDMGLIACALNGILKIYDQVDFKQRWGQSNEDRKQVDHINISALDFSHSSGLMAIGGVEGNMILVDSHAKGQIGSVKAHSCEIVKIFFYDEQFQIITIGKDRTIHVWDSHKLELIQNYKDQFFKCRKFTSAAFDVEQGKLYTACKTIKTYQSEIHSDVELNVLQIKTLSRDYQKEKTRNELIKAKQNPRLAMKVIGNCIAKELKTKKLGSKSNVDQRNGNVLVTSVSSLVDMSFLEEFDSLVTVDSKGLVRTWDLGNGEPTQSFNINLTGQVTAVTIDKENGLIAVGSDFGEAHIYNVFSGGLMYQLPRSHQEITDLTFVKGITDIWVAGSCWGGKVMTWTAPKDEHLSKIDVKEVKGHNDDIICIDSNQKYLATGGADGVVGVWSIVSGALIFSIPVPSAKDEERLSREKKSVVAQKIKKRKSILQPGTLKNRLAAGLTAQLQQSMNPSNYNSNQTPNKSTRSGKSSSSSFSIEISNSISAIKLTRNQPGILYVMHESGDIHTINSTNGQYINFHTAKGFQNSKWDLDKTGTRMMIIGEMGDAKIYSIPKDQDADWVLMKEFKAFDIRDHDPNYVIKLHGSTKFNMFVAGTVFGQVRLFSTEGEFITQMRSRQYPVKKILKNGWLGERSKTSQAKFQMAQSGYSNQVLKLNDKAKYMM